MISKISVDFVETINFALLVFNRDGLNPKSITLLAKDYDGLLKQDGGKYGKESSPGKLVFISKLGLKVIILKGND